MYNVLNSSCNNILRFSLSYDLNMNAFTTYVCTMFSPLLMYMRYNSVCYIIAGMGWTVLFYCSYNQYSGCLKEQHWPQCSCVLPVSCCRHFNLFFVFLCIKETCKSTKCCLIHVHVLLFSFFPVEICRVSHAADKCEEYTRKTGIKSVE